MFDFEVKLAQNKEEIEQALKLRHQVFNLEMDGLKQKEEKELDCDIYDKFCDHLIVIDKTINKTVGTYRLLLGSNVDKRLGFYAERLFDLSNIKRLAQDIEVLELGRSCIHKDYRSRPVINLLWNGIAQYIKDYSVRYLFGSTRLLTNTSLEVSKIFKFIKEKFYSPAEFRVYPHTQNKFKGLWKNIEVANPREILQGLPPLLKGYLKAGAWICGLPAINPDFGSTVIFMLLDVEKIPRSYKQHFL